MLLTLVDQDASKQGTAKPRIGVSYSCYHRTQAPLTCLAARDTSAWCRPPGWHKPSLAESLPPRGWTDPWHLKNTWILPLVNTSVGHPTLKLFPSPWRCPWSQERLPGRKHAKLLSYVCLLSFLCLVFPINS